MNNTHTHTTGAGNLSAAQILNNLTLAQAYAHAATTDKAAYVVDLLGVKSIHSPLFVELEDAIEERFHELRVADNHNGQGDSSALEKFRTIIKHGYLTRTDENGLTMYANRKTDENGENVITWEYSPPLSMPLS